MKTHEEGSVTSEFAIGLPAVAIVVLLILAVGTAAISKAKSCEAARTAARAVAIGQDSATAITLGQQIGGSGSKVFVSITDGWALAREQRVIGLMGRGLVIQCQAYSRAEDVP